MIAHSADIHTQSTPSITLTKCLVLINTNMKGTSTKCFGTSVPSSERTKCRFKNQLPLKWYTCKKICWRFSYYVCIIEDCAISGVIKSVL